VKSDDIVGRVKTYEAIVKGDNIPEPSIPESFKVLIQEMQSLCLDVTVRDENDEEIVLKEFADLGASISLERIISTDALTPDDGSFLPFESRPVELRLGDAEDMDELDADELETPAGEQKTPGLDDSHDESLDENIDESIIAGTDESAPGDDEYEKDEDE
jgi:DNA-directed RNA polymerase subunit beta